MIKVVLNELALTKGSSVEVRLWYDTFFETCLSLAKELNTKMSILYTTKLSDAILSNEMMFPKWLTSIENRDRKNLFLSMLTKSPLIFDYPYYYFETKQAKGLGYAFEKDLLPLSLNNHNKWNNLELTLNLELIDEELDKIITDKVTVRNAWDKDSSFSHLIFLERALLGELLEEIRKLKSGQELWRRREELFPSLLFCSVVENQLIKLSGDVLLNLSKRLLEMDRYFTNWNEGDFDPQAFSGNPRLESTTRINKFARQLSINCPDKVERLFSFHCNYGVDGTRLHFFPDAESRICWIGYLGKKIV